MIHAPGVPIAVELDDYLTRADHVILPSQNHAAAAPLSLSATDKLAVGVDLGTAFLVLVVLDEKLQPVVGEYQFAQVVRDGLVVDFIGAVDRLREMKQRVEQRLGIPLTSAASGYPPGVAQVEVRATANVVEAAGMTCTGLVDEPSAANNLLHVQNGVIVDVGGGTTGIAVVKDGQVVFTADEPTGGTHFSLVIAGAMGISFEEAEELKRNPAEQPRLFPLVRPVMEKVANIIARNIQGKAVERVYLVGGSSAFRGMAGVIQEYTGLPTEVPSRPLFVTPIGIAMHNAKAWET